MVVCLGVIVGKEWSGVERARLLLETLAPLDPQKHLLLWMGEPLARTALVQRGFFIRSWGWPSYEERNRDAVMYSLLLSRGKESPGEAFAFWDGEAEDTRRVLSHLKRCGLRMHITYPDPLISLARIHNSFL